MYQVAASKHRRWARLDTEIQGRPKACIRSVQQKATSQVDRAWTYNEPAELEEKPVEIYAGKTDVRELSETSLQTEMAAVKALQFRSRHKCSLTRRDSCICSLTFDAYIDVKYCEHDAKLEGRLPTRLCPERALQIT